MLFTRNGLIVKHCSTKKLFSFGKKLIEKLFDEADRARDAVTADEHIGFYFFGSVFDRKIDAERKQFGAGKLRAHDVQLLARFRRAARKTEGVKFDRRKFYFRVRISGACFS